MPHLALVGLDRQGESSQTPIMGNVCQHLQSISIQISSVKSQHSLNRRIPIIRVHSFLRALKIFLYFEFISSRPEIDTYCILSLLLYEITGTETRCLSLTDIGGRDLLFCCQGDHSHGNVAHHSPTKYFLPLGSSHQFSLSIVHFIHDVGYMHVLLYWYGEIPQSVSLA